MLTVPIGFICIYSGNIGNIPAGWHESDGTNGTPNLQQKFIIGASEFIPLDTVGGNASHLHGVGIDPHSHLISPGTGVLASGLDWEAETDLAEPDVICGLSDNRPPYHALYFIMKIS